jgi:hypothetical protein
MSNTPSEFTRMIESGGAAQSRKFYITDDPQTISVLTYASHLSEVAAHAKEVPAARVGDAHYRWRVYKEVS